MSYAPINRGYAVAAGEGVPDRPRNVPHRFRSIGGPATALLIVTPGGLDEYFAELHAKLSANEIATVQEKYGIVRA
jgi:hypothetical protein